MASFSTHDRARVLHGLKWPLRLTWAGLVAERLARSLWPLFAVTLAVLAALMLGLQDIVPIEVVWGAVVVATLGGLWSLAHAFRRFRLPTRDEALMRLDASLPGRPISALLDEQAIGGSDAASAAVWRAHQARMAERASQARAVPGDLNVAPRDPYALRYVAVLAFAVALLFGSIWRVGSVTEMAPGTGGLAAGGPVWEGWIEPPRYTGKPTLYLNDQPAGDLDVPLGSVITVRLYGEVGALTLSETVSGRTGDVPPASAPAQDFTVAQAGELEIAGPGGRAWAIAVLPDRPPSVTFSGDMEVSALGEMTLPFEARDDYGVEGGELRIALDLEAVDRRFGLALDPEDRPEIAVPLPLPITGDRAEFSEAFIDDFSKHPWANLPVKMQLSAFDAMEQSAQAEPRAMMLPGRRFFDPVAAAVIELRRDLLWNRDNGPRMAQIMRAISHRPDGVFRNETNLLRLRDALDRLELLASYGMTDDQQAELAEELWGLALLLEEGDLEDALERLRRAQERLEEAMRNGASDEEIAELMRELRQATDDYLRQLMQQQRQQAEQDGEGQPQGQQGEAMQMTQDDLQRMMDRIQELMEQGRMAEAEQALRELQEMMENMRVTQGQQGQGQSPGQEAMDGLAETLREQQGLSDQAFRDLQDQFNPGQQGQNPGQQGQQQGQGQGQGQGQQSQNQGQGQQGQTPGQQPGQGNAQNGQQGQQQGQGQGLEQSLADRQRALRDELRRQQGNLPGAGTPEGDAAREALDRAGRAMEGAEDALRSDDYAGAIDRQADAMEALREGMRNLGEALAQQQEGQPGQGEAEADRRSASRDPLGREAGSNGGLASDENLLQGGDVYRRAQELLDELRRRSGERDRSETERDYLDRLLERF